MEVNREDALKTLEVIFDMSEEIKGDSEPSKRQRFDLQKLGDSGMRDTINSMLFKIDGERGYKICYLSEAVDPLKWELEEYEEDQMVPLEQLRQSMAECISYREPDCYTSARKRWLMEKSSKHIHLVEEAIDRVGWEGVNKELTTAIGAAIARMREDTMRALIDNLPALISTNNHLDA